MTTIITKYGYGKPTGGQLAKAEVAVDLTDGILYSSTTGSDIIELGRGEISWENITGKPPVIDPDEGGDDYVDLKALEAQVEANKGDIALLKSAVSDLEADLADTNTEVGKNAAAILALDVRVGDNEDDIEELQNKVGKTETDISNLEGRVSTNETNIETNKNGISTLNSQINDAPDGLKFQVEANTGGVAQNAKDIEALQKIVDQDLTGLRLAGTYEVPKNEIVEVSGAAQAAGMNVGDKLSTHAKDDNAGFYFVVKGNGPLSDTVRAGSDGKNAQNGDWLVCDGVHGWILMQFGGDHVTWGAIGGDINSQEDLMLKFEDYIAKTDTINCGQYS